MFKNFIIALFIFTALFNTNKANAMPLIGEKAPSFKAETTTGNLDFPKDYQGNWVILFSHPADFTPVCTSEFIAFQKAQPKFEALNTKLIGLSEDNVEEHKKWLESIKDIEFNCEKNTTITFPIIGDKNQNIAKKYGMLQKDNNKEKTVRAVFIIDPDSLVRAIIYYPQTTGRYIPEIQRLLLALQTSDNFEVSTPANWMPGDDVIVPKSKLPEDISDKNLEAEDITKITPYLYTKKLDKETICDKLFKD